MQDSRSPPPPAHLDPVDSFEIVSATGSPNIRPVSPKYIQINSSKQIRLDIGGHKYSTTLTTLTADPSSMLAAMFSGRFPIEKNEEGSVFIDRDGQHFHHILNWLRNGYIPPIHSPVEQEALLIEARYYQVTSLVDFLSSLPPSSHQYATPSSSPCSSKFTLKELLELVSTTSSKKKVQLASADLSTLKLDGINLPGANLKFANLDDTTLQFANLSEVSLQNGRLARTDLQYADLSLSNLRSCSFHGAKLNYANLQGANLQGADLTNCDLQNANLECANLQGAILQGANVQHTNLMGAKLQGASLHGITNVHLAKGLKR